ncbi:Ger(x)C family spore germination protein [Neobacillus niacini]|uniref:Ger(x)C family spore germination protein n=1 Tax=Neobacillus niacini TaxID=86668 RepID=UPI001C8E24EA|nr:Ger(x)C family spore germination protein [Neobacillus niacini]MBY0147500.1 Ger(x)C family spore germination protein [Neobacillus niacini]
MRRVKRMLLPLCLLVLIHTSCSNERVVDQLHILTTLGFDKNKSGYTGTALYADLTQKGGKISLVQGKSNQIKLILNQMNNQSTKLIDIGKLKMIMFSKEVAQEGISHFLLTICKDPLISNYLFIAVTDESIASVSKGLKDKDRSSFPYYMIEQNMKTGNIPQSNLSTVLFDYYGEGRDFSVPYIHFNKNGETEIVGYGIFKDDRLKLFINSEEMILFKLLQGKFIQGDIPYTIRDEQGKRNALFSIQYGKGHQSVSKRKQETKVTYHLTLNGMVKEFPQGTQVEINESLVHLKKQLQTDLLKLLNKFKDEKVDPLGTGDLVRAHTRDWNEKQFYKEKYSNIKFDVDLNIQLTKSGIGE